MFDIYVSTTKHLHDAIFLFLKIVYLILFTTMYIYDTDMILYNEIYNNSDIKPCF